MRTTLTSLMLALAVSACSGNATGPVNDGERFANGDGGMPECMDCDDGLGPEEPPADEPGAMETMTEPAAGDDTPPADDDPSEGDRAAIELAGRAPLPGHEDDDASEDEDDEGKPSIELSGLAPLPHGDGDADGDDSGDELPIEGVSPSLIPEGIQCWDVYVLDLEILPAAWDDWTRADPMVTASRIGSADVWGSLPYQLNTLRPEWSEPLLESVTTDELLSGFMLRVADWDGVRNVAGIGPVLDADPIGQVSIRLPEEELGTAIEYPCGRYCSVVMDVVSVACQ